VRLEIRGSVRPTLRTSVAIHVARVLCQSAASACACWLRLSDRCVAVADIIVVARLSVFLMPSPKQNCDRAEQDSTAYTTDDSSNDAL
jgi:hypothetical protein